MSDEYKAEIPANTDPQGKEAADVPTVAQSSAGQESAVPEEQPQGNAGADEIRITLLAAGDLQDEIRLLAPVAGDETWPAKRSTLLIPAWSASSAPPRPVTAASQPAPRRRARMIFTAAVAALVILSLVGSSVFSLYWFWQTRQQRVAEVNEAIAGGSGIEDNSLFAEERSAAEMVRPQPVVSPVVASQIEPVNRIAFINEARQIATIAPDGSEERQLTRDGNSYLFPAWSPDSSLIAALGSNVGGGGVYVVPDAEDAGQPRELYRSRNETPFYLYWSPDSNRISFLANADSGLSLNVVDAGGESDSSIVALGSPLYWQWASNGRQMLVHAGREEGDSQLVMIDDAGRRLTQQVPTPGLFQAPGISPSGRYWAYSQFQAGGTTWMVIDDRTTGEQTSHRHAGSTALNWSPVRDELAFISGESQNMFSSWGPLRLMDAATGDVRLLSAERVLAFFWSPDGEKIATISLPVDDGLGEQYEVRNLKDRRLTRTRPQTAETRMVQFIPHSFRVNVVDVASGEGLHLAEVSLSPAFLSQFIPYFDQYNLSHHLWSPDSNFLVLPVVTDRRSEITIIDARNGKLTALVPGRIGFWSGQ